MKFEEPKLQVEALEVEDVITVSGVKDEDEGEEDPL